METMQNSCEFNTVPTAFLFLRCLSVRLQAHGFTFMFCVLPAAHIYFFIFIINNRNSKPSTAVELCPSGEDNIEAGVRLRESGTRERTFGLMALAAVLRMV
jgi:hypothetical protein